MDSPVRIQRKRIKGWKMPPNTRYVGRPTKWGNPCLARGHAGRTAYKIWVDLTRSGKWSPGDGMLGAAPFPVDDLGELRGKNLACWCPLDAPCHVDVLLPLANPESEAA